MKTLVGILFLAAINLSTTASASTLNIKTFTPGSAAIFPVTSTLIYGSNDAILIDAQFQKKYAKKIVEMVRSSGKNLKYIFISYSDPDYYFGLDEIKKSFPQAQVIATAQTAYLISATKDAKMDIWKEKLGKDAPENLHVPEAMTTKKLSIDGQEIDIIHDDNDTAHSYLWIPSLKTVLGSISVSTGGHLWMADTPTVQDIDLWIKRINAMQSLKPEKVIPGHSINNDTSPKSLNFIKKYLIDYKKSALYHKNSADIIANMEKVYPSLPGRGSLEFGAKVFAGEVPWHITTPYPPIGKTAEVNFGGTVFELHFSDNKTMSFEGMSGTFKGVKDTVKYTAIEVSKNIYMVYWHEPHTGSNVVHVQDWNTGTVYTNIAAKDNSFTHLTGTIKIK
ncbi:MULTISPECIES: MBL fold metallo-hydrolase [unclassified Serratia (in: enterobacteria)]|uniref:MoaF-related domain-containing protein n=1 Tax=unclassified Serratia (in: enterobacteria) TaxID=2647522 RepID=UPI0027EE393B|nr:MULTISPECIES: MBL fold metallo-hydrolase [unclassified Serratia (in: enterobacteria)]MDQ7098781.1 MBL fold metallo-hydrolase [Serratia sp. MF2]MDQ7102374.1 MBL fold metallo-hydrolase [Serratia sp. MF1(2023)]